MLPIQHVRSICLVLALAACSEEPGSECGPSQGLVTAVIDGDTIEIDDSIRIRYLLIDAPELGTCYGAEAKLENQALVLDEVVDLTYDPAVCTDMYGRTLAFVSRSDGTEANTKLVRSGYACDLYIPPGGEQRRQEFASHESFARSSGSGMWSQCPQVSCQ